MFCFVFFLGMSAFQSYAKLYNAFTNSSKSTERIPVGMSWVLSGVIKEFDTT